MKEEKRNSLGFIVWIPVLVTVTLLIIELLTTNVYVRNVLWIEPSSTSGKSVVIALNSSMAGAYVRLLLLPLSLALAGTFGAGRKACRTIGVISIIASGLQLLLAFIYYFIAYRRGADAGIGLRTEIPGAALFLIFQSEHNSLAIFREALLYIPTIVTLIIAFCAKEKEVAVPQNVLQTMTQPEYTQPLSPQPVYQTVIRPEPVQPVFIPQPVPAAEPEPDPQSEPQPKPIDPQPVWQPQTEALPHFCAACGAQLPTNGLFCPKCGTRRT